MLIEMTVFRRQQRIDQRIRKPLRQDEDKRCSPFGEKHGDKPRIETGKAKLAVVIRLTMWFPDARH